MKYAFLLMLALGLQGPDPNHPFPNHEMPPADWFCSREATDRAHFCLCSGMVDNPKCPMPQPDTQNSDDSEGDSKAYPPEDPQCKTFCHRDHCTCKTSCKDTMMEHHPQVCKEKA